MEYGIKIINAIASGLLMFAISLGALASHLLKTKLSQDSLSSFEVGVRYLIYHGLALLIVNELSAVNLDVKLTFSKLVLSGIFLFSGSIFMLSTRIRAYVCNISRKFIFTCLDSMYFIYIT